MLNTYIDVVLFFRCLYVTYCHFTFLPYNMIIIFNQNKQSLQSEEAKVCVALNSTSQWKDPPPSVLCVQKRWSCPADIFVTTIPSQARNEYLAHL